MIRCLLCAREFRFLAPHLRLTHGTTDRDYRAAFEIPAGVPLASADYRAAHSEKFKRMLAIGIINHEHLPSAVEKARGAKRRQRTRTDLAEQSARATETQPWAVRQLQPGAKRADGRDADRAREYQREYRRKHSALDTKR